MHASRFFHLKAGLINYSKYAGDMWEKGEGVTRTFSLGYKPMPYIFLPYFLDHQQLLLPLPRLLSKIH